MSKCTSVTKVDTLTTGEDVLNVCIDDTTHAFWFYNYADALKFVGEEVIVEFRKDIYKGELQQFIATFVKPTYVTTLDKQVNIKLYCDQVDNNSNLSFNEVDDGETRQGCIVFCTYQEFKSSGNAVWQELIIRDKSMHTAKLRLFDPKYKDVNFVGQYVMTELSRNKYGFKSEMISPVNGQCPPNPEIEIAKKFINNYFANDTVALDFISSHNLIGALEENIDYEKGYGLMRLAMELSMVDNLNNISKDVDVTAIGHALLASRSYLTTGSVLSNSVVNVTTALHHAWPNRRVVAQLLDEALEEKPKEYLIMKSIKDTIDTILRVRKGTLE